MMRPNDPLHSGMEAVVRTNLLLLGSYRTAQHDDNAFVIPPVSNYYSPVGSPALDS